MPTYDSTQFDPPAPLARVTLRTLNNSNIVTDVPMLIDSGADLTLIPARFIEDLKLEVDQSESYEVQGFDGNRSVAASVQLELVFLRRSFRGRFLLVNSPSGILGRNVINHFAILLDGPELSWELKDTVK
jgi:hypothetical protein